MASKLTLGSSQTRGDYVKAVQSYKRQQNEKRETIARLMRGEFRNTQERTDFMEFMARHSRLGRSFHDALPLRGFVVPCAELDIVPVYDASTSRINISSESKPAMFRISGIPASIEILSAVYVADGIARPVTPSEIARLTAKLSKGASCGIIKVEGGHGRQINPATLAEIVKAASRCHMVGAGHGRSLPAASAPSLLGRSSSKQVVKEF